MKIDKKVREYLSRIGAIGGQTSRRDLFKKQARQMVAIREAKREALRKGDVEFARKRIPLPKEKIKPERPWPATYRRPTRW